MDATETSTPPPAPHFAVAGAFLEAIAAHDFVRLTEALEVDASLLALLPSGFREWHGSSEIGARFEGWFGDTEQFEVVDASVGQVGPRLQLCWRIRLQAARLGAGPRVIEQYAYAGTGSTGRIQTLSLLCSGFCEEHVDG